MLYVSALQKKIQTLCQNRSDKSLSQLGEVLGIASSASRQAKTKKVQTTILNILDGFMALESIAYYLETTPEYLILNEHAYQKLFPDPQAAEKQLSLTEKDRALVETLIQRLARK